MKLSESLYLFFSIVVLSIFTFCFNVYAEKPEEKNDNNVINKYYLESEQPGYWWNKDLEEKKIEEDKKKEIQPQVKIETKEEEVEVEDPEEVAFQKEKLRVRKAKTIKAFSYEELWNMHPDNLQALIDKIMKKANTGTPEPSVVKEFYVLVDLVKKRATSFTAVSYYVGLNSPELDEPWYGGTPMESDVYYKTRLSEVRKELNSQSGEYAILFFTEPNCPYCDKQQVLLDSLNRKLTLENQFQLNIRKARGKTPIAKAMNIQQVPALVLISKNNKDKFIPISRGLLKSDQIEHNIYAGIRLMKGEITPDEFFMYAFEKDSATDAKATIKRGHQDLKSNKLSNGMEVPSVLPNVLPNRR